MDDLLIARQVHWRAEELDCFKERKFVVDFGGELYEGVEEVRGGAREGLEVVPVDGVFDLRNLILF